MIGAPEARLQKIRGNDISFIFQEPMTSLNPLHTIEAQITESLALHQGLSGPAARARVLDLLDMLVELLLLLVVHGFSNLNRGRTHAHDAGLGRRATSLPPFRASSKPRRS